MKNICMYTTEGAKLYFETATEATAWAMELIKEYIKSLKIKQKNIINIQYYIESAPASKITIESDDYPNTPLKSQSVKMCKCVGILTYCKQHNVL